MKKIIFISLFLLVLPLTTSSQSKSNFEIQLKVNDLNREIDRIDKRIEEINKKLEAIEYIEESIKSSRIDSVAIEQRVRELLNLKKSSKSTDIALGLIRLEGLSDRWGTKIWSSLYGLTRRNDDPTFRDFDKLRDDLTSIRSNGSRYLRVAYDDIIKEDSIGEVGTINYQEFEKFQASLSIEKVLTSASKAKEEFVKKFNDFHEKTKNQKADYEKSMREKRAEILKLSEQQSAEANYDRTVFQWGFPVFIVFILSLYLFPLWFLHQKEASDGKAITSLYKLIYGSGILTEIVTVFLLTSTILLLGITNKLNPDIPGTLIGGISGYVLGRSFKGQQNNPPPQN